MKLQKIKHYDGLYGDLNFRRRNDYIFLEKIETRSVDFGWVIDAHFHANLYQFFFVRTGHVEFHGSEETREIETPCILVIPPGTLHGLRYDTRVEGSILTLSDMVVEAICAATPAVLMGLEKFNYLVFANNKEIAYTRIDTLLREVDEELFETYPEKQALLNACFLQLFIYLSRLLQNTPKQLPDNNATLQHFRSFLHLIKKSDSNRSISSFADEIGISTGHLNRICKQVSGKSALLLVQEQKVEQSKNYLTHTSYSIAEIAYQLNFEYPNYFAKLFRKLTGLTPTEYRNKKREQD